MGAIQTYSNRFFNPLDPDPEQIVIEDIAHALANICRYTGHVRCFYSVAEHCCRASDAARPENKLWLLLHDAGEAYIGDIARPVKYQPGFGTYYRGAQHKLDRVIYDKFGLFGEEPEEVDILDYLLLRTEQRDLMPPVIEGKFPSIYIDTEDPEYGEYEGPFLYEERIEPWLPKRSEEEFLRRFFQLAEGAERETELSAT